MKKLILVTVLLAVSAMLSASCTRAAAPASPASVSTPAATPEPPVLTPAPIFTAMPAPTAAPVITSLPVTAPTPAFSPAPFVQAPIPEPDRSPTPPPVLTPQPDISPPSPITGLVAVNAYDGKANLFWERSRAPDFDHYNVYTSKSPVLDAAGLKPVNQIVNMANNWYQVSGLEAGSKQYFAVSTVDKSGNENRQLTWTSVISTVMPRGTKDPNLIVDIYQPDRVWAGTTLLTLNHDPQRRRIVEVNMLGEVVWEYLVPQRGFVEAELLSNNNLLYTVGQIGIFEIDRSGMTVWSYMDRRASHDADRLLNGNTIFVNADDQKSDPQVIEVNPQGQIVWEWYAKDHFDRPPYRDIVSMEGHWTHTNAVTRLPNGNTLVSTRNFNIVVEVDPKGKVVGTYGEGILVEPHDPEVLPNGNILAASHNTPERAVEIDPKTNRIVWQFGGFPQRDKPVRDANRLPNGNTLITANTRIVEVTPDGKIVWQFAQQGIPPAERQVMTAFYKADRISLQR